MSCDGTEEGCGVKEIGRTTRGYTIFVEPDMSDRDPAFESWVQRARDVGLEQAAELAGAKLKRNGREMIGPCCNCGGVDRLSVAEHKGVWNCRGAEGGNDPIGLVMHCAGVGFVAAVEMLTGEPPPGRASNVDHDAIRRRQAEVSAARARQDAERAAAEARETLTTRQFCERLFGRAMPIAGTHAQAYLEARGLIVLPGWTFDLRFVRSLPYRGYATPEAEQAEHLGDYPTMLAAIRDVDGVLIGVHRTYLDPVDPVKLKPPGDPARNRAKKIVGDVSGGMIRLSPIGRRVGLGEGIETTRSWFVLGGGDGGEVSIAAAVSMGNLCGQPTGTIDHPRPPPSRPKAKIPNGIPDLSKPGVRLPDCVKHVFLIGDGDSDEIWTKQMLLVAGVRFAGEGRTVDIQMADAGKDFNDMLVEELASEHAA